MLKALGGWFDATILDLGRQLRLSYLPPLMVYLAAGISGLTAIVGTFFIKDYLGLSAAFLAGLGFWAGIPWALKMPLGHLVDLIWRRKFLLVYLGAALIALSIAIMYGLIAHTAAMARLMAVEAWYVLSALLAPVGYVVQDVVADAMTVEAVPPFDEQGRPYPEAEIKAMHTTMQTLGRFAVIGGLMLVAALNISMFAGVETMSEAEKTEVYAADLPDGAGDPGALDHGRDPRRHPPAPPGAPAAGAGRRAGAHRRAVPAGRGDQPELVDLRRQPRVRRLHLDHGAGPGAVRPGDRLPGLHGDRRCS